MNEGGVRWIRFSDDLPGWVSNARPGMRLLVIENRGTPFIKNIRIAPSLDRPARPDLRDDDVVLASYCYTDESTLIELVYDFVVARYGVRYVGFFEDECGKYDQGPGQWEHPESSALDAIKSFNAMIGVYFNKALGDPLDYILETAVSDNKEREKNYKGYGDWA